jgi:hypothetical protein
MRTLSSGIRETRQASEVDILPGRFARERMASKNVSHLVGRPTKLKREISNQAHLGISTNRATLFSLRLTNFRRGAVPSRHNMTWRDKSPAFDAAESSHV